MQNFKTGDEVAVVVHGKNDSYKFVERFDKVVCDDVNDVKTERFFITKSFDADGEEKEKGEREWRSIEIKSKSNIKEYNMRNIKIKLRSIINYGEFSEETIKEIHRVTGERIR